MGVWFLPTVLSLVNCRITADYFVDFRFEIWADGIWDRLRFEEGAYSLVISAGFTFFEILFR